MEDFLCMIKRDSSKGTSEETAMLDLKLRGNPLDCNCMDYQLYALEKTAYDYARIYRHTVCNLHQVSETNDPRNRLEPVCVRDF
jgi:hypothetical protein